MIGIVDNGQGAEEIQQLIPKSEIIKPSEISKGKFDAYILSDGAPTQDNQKHCIKLIQEPKRPILGIGLGFLYMGAAFGGEVVPVKPANKNARLKILHPSPIVTDLKFVSVNDNSQFALNDLPDCFEVITEGSNGPEIIQDIELPLIGTRFNPAESPDAIKMFQNFLKFVETYDQYHK